MGILSTLVQPIAQIGSTLIQNRAQKKAQQREFANNKQMWNLANTYNSPTAQMSRLKEAGLNPNMIYGSGSSVGNTSTQTPKYQAPTIQRLPLETASPIEMLGQFFDLRQKSAQANLTENAAKIKEAEAGWIDKTLAQSVIKAAHGNRNLESLTGRQYQWSKEMGRGKLGFVESGTGNNLYLKSISADVQDKQNRNALQQIQLNFMKSVPKEYQWMAPLFLNLLKTIGN